MNTKSSDLVVLQWLVISLNEELDEIHESWQTAVAEQTFLPQAERFHAIANVMNVAQLDVFAKLAYLLERICRYMHEGKLDTKHAAKVLYASRLLYAEINRYVLTGVHESLLTKLRIRYMQEILQTVEGGHGGLGELVAQDRFSQKVNIVNHEIITLSTDDKKKLILAWRHASKKLLDANQNVSENLQMLAKVARYAMLSSQSHLAKCVWQFANFWLSSLALNSHPTPSQYAHLLDELNKVVSSGNDSSLEVVVWLENLLIDLYIQLGVLKVVSENAHEFLTSLNYKLSNETLFFPHILGMLEGMLFALSRGEISQHILEEIKEQLGGRGWSFYESYADQIIQDIIATQDDPQAFAQMQWQINTQLQDLYTSISNTYEVIQSKIGEGVGTKPNQNQELSSQLRRVRILIEEVKYSFNDYLHTKDPKTLASSSIFGELDGIFAEMAMYDVAKIISKINELFGVLQTTAPTQLSFSFAHAAAESLSLVELFLDGLAKQVFDHALLMRAKQSADKANHLLVNGDDSEQYQVKKVNDNQIRYNDSGAITPDISQLSPDFDDFADPSTDTKTQDSVIEGSVIEDSVIEDSVIEDIAIEDVAIDEPIQHKLVDDEPTAADEVGTNSQLAKTSVAPSAAYLEAKQALKEDSFDFDEDIREIFIEEAVEVLETLVELLPIWQVNPTNHTPLKDIRRGFHTLKGSGRMVGAYSVGETAWAVENMLNRVLDGSLTATSAIANFVADTASLIPVLMQDFANKVEPSVDPANVIVKANNILAGRMIDEGVFEQMVQPSISQPNKTQEIEATYGQDDGNQEDDDKGSPYQLDDAHPNSDESLGDIEEALWQDIEDDAPSHDTKIHETQTFDESIGNESVQSVQSVQSDALDYQEMGFDFTDDFAQSDEALSSSDTTSDESVATTALDESAQTDFDFTDDFAQLDEALSSSDTTSDDLVATTDFDESAQADFDFTDDFAQSDEALSSSDTTSDESVATTDFDESAQADFDFTDDFAQSDEALSSSDTTSDESVATTDFDESAQADFDFTDDFAQSDEALSSSDTTSDDLVATTDFDESAQADFDFTDDFVSESEEPQGDVQKSDAYKPSEYEQIESTKNTDQTNTDEVQSVEVMDHSHDIESIGQLEEVCHTQDEQTLQTQIIEDIEDIEPSDEIDAVQTHDEQFDEQSHPMQEQSLPEVLTPFMQEAQIPLVSQVDSVDEDIKEIFVEEASEVLETIIPLFEEWKTSRDIATLTDIRRGFHTLKGSGRMVGAVELGELAWSIENMLNRVLDNTVTIDAGMIALIGDVLDEFGILVGIFEKDTGDYPQKILLWRAVAHAYSKGHGKQINYPSFGEAAADIAPSVSADTAADTVNELADDESVQDTDVFVATKSQTPSNTSAKEGSKGLNIESIQEATEALSKIALPTPKSEEEDMLCGIFVEEAKELLEVVKTFLDDNLGEDSVAVSDEVVRVFHTLRGAMGLAPLKAIGELGAKIETGLQALQRHDEPMNMKHLQAIGSSVEMIEMHLDAYEGIATQGDQESIQLIDEFASEQGAGISDFDLANLIEGIDTLLDAELDLESMVGQADKVVPYAQSILEQIEILEARTANLGKFQRLLLSLSAGYRILVDHPEQGQNDEFVDVLLNAQGQLTGLFDSLAGSMSLRLDDKVLSALDSKVADIQEYHRSIDNHSLVVSQSVAEPTEAVRFQEVTADPELLEIFLEEAAELDESIGESFGAWKNDTSNIDALKALQRHLHTVKGGARLAGISSIGDLTHEAETIYERMVDGRLSPSEDWVRIMQGVQDLLSLQLDELKQNNRSFFADGAVAKLQQFLEAGEVPTDAVIAMPAFDEQIQTSVVVSQEPEPAQLSDFEHRQLRSWHGVLPDEDILQVFLEEAEELVETSGEDFQLFRSNTGDVATLQVLQRKLHTIKGGARMVTATGLADLAHHMETVYEDLATRRRPATRMIVQLLMTCHDFMVAAMTLLKANLNPPTPTALIDALEAFSKNPDSLVQVPVVSLAEELDAIAQHELQEQQRRGGRDISRMPPTTGLFELAQDTTNNNEMIRISAPLMERMINLSGEAAINRARIDMSMTGLTSSIEEMGVTVQRLADQLRRMDIELEAQIMAQIDDKTLFEDGDFDPLEMDQYSSLNQLSKSLSESASDLLDLKATMLERTRDGENLLLQLSRTQTELQDGLMYSRMVPFSRLTPRLQRIVRQVSTELGKNVELVVVNADDEMDRTILERITSPLEHMLRNAIDHGIEMPEARELLGKPKTGTIKLEVTREGSEILVHLIDDGAGINVEAVRKKAISQGLIAADDTSLSDLDIMQYIFNAGLSTTSVVTQISGRGVGMDVVRSEIRQLGGSVSVDSERGKGSKFTMRVPLTVAVSDTLVVRAADRQYAVPLVQIERITQVSTKQLMAYYRSTDATISIDGVPYRLRYLNEILSGHNLGDLAAAHQTLPVILIKNQTGQNLALQVDEIIGSRIEVVVKPLGRQLSHVSGISAATIMGDGSVMFILDLMALIRNARARVAIEVETTKQNKRPVILVVDDSVTVRKVTSRFLERQGFEAVVAKDGVDAIEILQELTPDLMLLDIEMPRMDGFEVATQVRHNSRLKDLPIIMITSRTGEKHRERAFEIGVTDYMGKPFQENELLNRIGTHLMS